MAVGDNPNAQTQYTDNIALMLICGVATIFMACIMIKVCMYMCNVDDPEQTRDAADPPDVFTHAVQIERRQQMVALVLPGSENPANRAGEPLDETLSSVTDAIPASQTAR
jgi:hypothetical protein